jgi:ATP-binding cassette, subfamily B, bacterial HlyB/CyaB
MPALDCLRRYPLFNLFDTAQLEAWVSAGQEVVFETGETIFQEGSEGAWVYLVLKGNVRVVRRSEAGEEISLGRLGPGEVFGEYALLPPHRNTATCRAAGRVRLLSLPLLPLRSACAAVPGVATNLKNWLRLHGLLSFLREQVFVGFMSVPTAIAFFEHLQPVLFRAGETIQADGLGVDYWYFIQKGEVSLDLDGGVVQKLGPGDCFGEQTLLWHDRLPVAVALKETFCQCLPRKVFGLRPTEKSSIQSAIPQLTDAQKAYVWVAQREVADCGLAALAMVSRYHGLNISLEQLRNRASVGGRGANLKELQEAGSALGLHCLAVQVEAARMGRLELPAIALLKSQHYVVLYELSATGVFLGDPATGIVRQSIGAFAGACSGNWLLLRPPPVEGSECCK